MNIYTDSLHLMISKTLLHISLLFSCCHCLNSLQNLANLKSPIRIFGNTRVGIFNKGFLPFMSKTWCDAAPSWEDISNLIRNKESILERENFNEQLVGRGSSNAQSVLRLFDSSAGFEPEITLFRDSAAWCPYCSKVWLQLEEKRIPYRIEKVPLRCYGEKPASFMRINPSGGLPVAIIKGKTISESNVIMEEIEKQFPEYKPLLSSSGSPTRKRHEHLMQLERKTFSTWFSWLTSRQTSSAAYSMDLCLKEVDNELSVESSGPYFFGKDISLIDIMFMPFLERMAASLPYFKGFESRSKKYPNLLAWYEAMDQRPAYMGIKSDYYTHCHDLPPQIGNCQSLPEAKPFAEEIDGGAWSLAVKAGSCLEPMIPLDEGLACRDAVRRSIHNHEKLVRFCLRGCGSQGSPRVSAALADPHAFPNEKYIAPVDSALRFVLFAMLDGIDEGKINTIKSSGYPVNEVVASLNYLKNRIGVPRDMMPHSARMFRAHINWFNEVVSTS